MTEEEGKRGERTREKKTEDERKREKEKEREKKRKRQRVREKERKKEERRIDKTTHTNTQNKGYKGRRSQRWKEGKLNL